LLGLDKPGTVLNPRAQGACWFSRFSLQESRPHYNQKQRLLYCGASFQPASSGRRRDLHV